jgi:hypothetical protein
MKTENQTIEQIKEVSLNNLWARKLPLRKE